ncbi:hypothetical protein AB1Y20_008320 [Prymnesium parvum]|uniref:Uncharacterized protein n=1 Tax=Prymnesium parvum TaxID=97485 RepID=A0AB34IWI9_PRYPA
MSACWELSLRHCARCPAAPRTPAAAAAHNLSRCMPCGTPQRHTPCHAAAAALQQSLPRGSRSFESAQAAIHARGGPCERPCDASDWPAAGATPAARLAALRRALGGFWGEGGGGGAARWAAEWRALVRARLEEGARRAACSGSVRRRLVCVDGGAEQMHKNKFVVMDAMFVARSLGRTLVEPRVRHARLAGCNRSEAGPLALHHYWDLEPICRRVDLLPARKFQREWEGRELWRSAAHFWPKRGKAYAGGWRLHTAAAVRAAFRGAEKAPILVLHDFWRSVSNDEIDADDAPLPHERFPLRPSLWELNPAYEAIAALLLAQLGGERSLLAVQWRSEDWDLSSRRRANASAPAALLRCATWAARRVRAALASRRLTAAFLATDLRPRASASYAGARQPAALAALRRLEAAVPQLRTPRLRQLLDAIADGGVRAAVEASICARAALLLSTAAACEDCRRARRCAKAGSAFAGYIARRREAYGREVAPLF